MAEIEIFRARNTTGLAINNIRVTRTKPYGLIQTMQNYVVDDKAIIEAIGADVQPVLRGYWKNIMMSEATGWDLTLTGGRDEVLETVCSECGDCCAFDGNGDDYLSPYCPNCGARMDGDVE